jgi:hypothetical protein
VAFAQVTLFCLLRIVGNVNKNGEAHGKAHSLAVTS